MNKQKTKNQALKRRAIRTRARLSGTADRPRLSVHRTLKHISVQLIDDVNAKTLAHTDDRSLTGAKKDRAIAVGKKIAELAKEKGITTVIFDRGAYRYQGRVAAMADGAREAGLTF